MIKTLIYLSNNATTKRLGYINSDNQGIYFGPMHKDNWHITYHSDGVFHERRSIDNKGTEIQKAAIKEIDDYNQITFCSIPLDSELLANLTLEKRQHEESIVIEGGSFDKEIVNLDFYIVSKTGNASFENLVSEYYFKIIAQYKIPIFENSEQYICLIVSEQSSVNDLGYENNSDNQHITIELGKFSGRKGIYSNEAGFDPSNIAVERYPSNKAAHRVFHKACLIHEQFIPDNGCSECGN